MTAASMTAAGVIAPWPMLAQASDRPFVQLDWVLDHLDDIWAATFEHLVLTASSVGIGLVISAGLAILSLRSDRVYEVVVNTAGILYSIPALAAFAFLVPFFGLSAVSAIIPLVTYTLLILVRNIVTGIRGVDASIVEAARGMGHPERDVLWKVQVPLALPVIVAGLRIATVTTVGLVTVASLIGYGGLGGLILSGLRRSIPFATEIVVGIVGSILLATALDLLLVGIGKALTPWTRVAGAST